MRMRFLVRMAWAACSAALFTTRLNACSASDAHPAIVGTAIPGDRGMPLSIAKHPIFRKPEAQQQIPLHGNCSLSVDDETTVHLFLRRAQHMPEHGLARRSLASTVTNSYQQTQARLLTATGVCTQQRSTITRTRTKTVTHHSTVRTTRTVTRTVHRKTQTKHKSKFTRTTKSKPKTSRPSTSRSSHRTNSQPTQTHNFSETSRASSQKSTSRTAAVSTQKAVGSSAANGMLSGFPLQAVSAHNWWRKVYHVGGLRWNATLAAHALEWGKQCRWEHDPRLQGWMEGQNMATEGSSDGSAVITGDSMVSSWVKGDPDRGLYERTAYDPDNPQASHFTQVVWASATQIGCALINCPASFAAIYSPSWPAAKLAVCNYNTGNIVGQFGNNVPAKKGGQPR